MLTMIEKFQLHILLSDYSKELKDHSLRMDSTDPDDVRIKKQIKKERKAIKRIQESLFNEIDIKEGSKEHKELQMWLDNRNMILLTDPGPEDDDELPFN